MNDPSLPPLRPPAVPLVTHGPHFSTWSFNDRLTDDWSKHWTGQNRRMCGLARIDGVCHRFIGPRPPDVPAMCQLSVEVLPTRTIYRFEAAGVELKLTFLTPALLHDLEVFSRPVTYLIFEARSMDGTPHDVSIYFHCSSEWAVNTIEQQVFGGRCRVGKMQVLRIGSLEQPILRTYGDDHRMDWGYLYLALSSTVEGDVVLGAGKLCRAEFLRSGLLPENDDMTLPRPVKKLSPVLACRVELGKVDALPKSGHVLLAYDDIFSVEFMQQRLPPFWRRNGDDMGVLLPRAEADFESVRQACEEFDAALMADLRRVGGEKYARICALSYRQSIAAHGLVADPMDSDMPLFFSKENFSNGCIATVDVTYPSSPLYLLFNPALLKGMLTPVFRYAALPRWKFPFAPHDLGTYPLANGQYYGGGERSEEDQMPVEECGNMLILTAAIARVEGNAGYALAHWPLLTKWAEYLRSKGFDPENQLCTDDFAGHLAHNANLSIKAILGLAAYGMLCGMTGKKIEAADCKCVAGDMAKQWMQRADDGDHYRLAFDQPGSWSQKYNLIWDKLLGLEVFPDSVARREVAYYRTKLNPFGLPLDNRSTYTTIDHSIWAAALSGSDDDFAAVLDAIYRYPHESVDRVPLGDWCHTHNGRQLYFRARSVVGGNFMKLLIDRMKGGISS